MVVRAGKPAPEKIRRDGSGEEVSREGRAPSLTGLGSGYEIRALW